MIGADNYTPWALPTANDWFASLVLVTSLPENLRALAYSTLMSLYILGINHRTAPVAIREQVAFSIEQLRLALPQVIGVPDVEEALIVSTCNRTELYCECREDGIEALTSWLAESRDLTGEDRDCLFSLQGRSAINHVFTVACGLDSMIIGEPQILGQMKDAYRIAHSAGATGPALNRLFQQAFAVAKKVRTDAEIGASPVSVAYAAVTLSRQIFAGSDRHTAMLIGAGDTIELVARYLHRHDLQRLVVANRSIERARTLARQYSGYAISLDEIPTHLAEADIIISSTASPDPVISYDTVVAALSRRRPRPVLIVDIAVPRDVDSKVQELEDIYLYTVDDLHNVIEENLDTRRDAAHQAEQIIETEVERFDSAERSLDAVPTIRDLRDTAATIRNEAVEQAKHMLAAGKEPEEVLEFLATTLTQKLLHEPSVRLREAGADASAALIEAARELFGLEKGKY